MDLRDDARIFAGYLAASSGCGPDEYVAGVSIAQIAGEPRLAYVRSNDLPAVMGLVQLHNQTCRAKGARSYLFGSSITAKASTSILAFADTSGLAGDRIGSDRAEDP